MLSRISVHPTQRAQPTVINIEERGASESPPQIMISLPSPKPTIGSSHEMEELKDVVHFPPVVLDESAPRTRATLPSTWTPKRPPSPCPRPRRVHGKHMRNTSTHLTTQHSPPPPIPRFRVINPDLIHHTENMSFESTPYFLHSRLGALHSLEPHAPWDGSSEEAASIGMHLKARAMKTATYAIHDGGIISPF